MEKFIIVRRIEIVFFPVGDILDNISERIQDKIQFIVRHSRVDRHTHPAGFFGKVAQVNSFGNMFRLVRADMEQIVTVSAGARASAAHLDTEAIIQ